MPPCSRSVDSSGLMLLKSHYRTGGRCHIWVHFIKTPLRIVAGLTNVHARDSFIGRVVAAVRIRKAQWALSWTGQQTIANIRVTSQATT
jgi:hypothetical protein